MNNNNNNNTPTEKRKTFFGFGKRKSSTSSTSSNPNNINKKTKKSFFRLTSKKSKKGVVPKSMTKSEINLQMKQLHNEYRKEQAQKFKNAARRLGNTSPYNTNNNYEFIGAENPYAELFSNKNSRLSLNSGYSGSRSSLNSGYSDLNTNSNSGSNTNSLNNKNNIPNLPNLPNLPTVPSFERLSNLKKERLPEKMAIEKQNIKEEINILTNLIDRNLPLDKNTKYKNEIISTICKYNEDIKKKQEQLAKLNL